MAHLVSEVLGMLDASPAVVFGISMGGDVALNLALGHPTDIAALVLISPGGLAPVLRNRAVQFGAWALAQLPDPLLLLPLARFANRFVEQALNTIVKDPSALPPEVVSEFVRETRHPRMRLEIAFAFCVLTHVRISLHVRYSTPDGIAALILAIIGLAVAVGVRAMHQAS